MSEDQSGAGSQGSREIGFTGGGALRSREPRAWKPFAVAGCLVLIIIGALLFFGRQQRERADHGGAGLAAALYAASLPITQIQMSDSSTIGVGQQTYLDGVVTNRGSKTVEGITVQVAFKSYTGQLSSKDTLPLNWVRMTQPYIDTEPVSAEPLKPGESHAFRLIFDSVPQDWDGQYPAVRIVSVDMR